MGTLSLKKPSTRRAEDPPSPEKTKVVRAPAAPRHLGGTDAAARLRQMQEDMDTIAGVKR